MSGELPITIASKVTQTEYFEYKGKKYDLDFESSNELLRHGGPFDRGSADSYYGRPPHPHFYVEGTGTSAKVERSMMDQDQIDAYYAGYEWNEQEGIKKDW